VLDRWPCAGLAVAVIAGRGLAWFHGHGLADVAARTPVSEETVCRIGSITKTFTAVAGDAAVGARSGGPRRTGERLPSQLSAGSDEVGVAAADCATPPDAYSGVGYSRRLSDLLQPGVGSGVRAGRSRAPAPADYYRRGCLWRSSRGRRPSATTWCSRTNQPIRPAGNPVRNHISQSGRGLSRRRRRSRATARSNSASVSRGMKSLDADVVT
jgi:hypothetical protein